jgi:hypothetical protein
MRYAATQIAPVQRGGFMKDRTQFAALAAAGRFVVVFSIYLAALAPAAEADTVFSSFVSGHNWICCFGSAVDGPAAVPGVPESQAMGHFTPSGNFDLTEIDLPVWFAPLVNTLHDTDGFVLSLRADSGGLPGATIETWKDLAALIPPGDGPSSEVISVFPNSTVKLVSGHRYWVVASPSAPNTNDAWNLNYPPPVGTMPAFDVLGTPVPESGLGALSGIILLAIAFAHGFSCLRRKVLDTATDPKQT